MMIHDDVIDRYVDVISSSGIEQPECAPDPGTDLAHLLWMLEEMRNKNVDGENAHRWLGFVQGVLVSRGLAEVSVERDFTRPYFTPKLGGDR